MSDILNQKARSFFDEVDLFEQTANTFNSFKNESSTEQKYKNWNLEMNIDNSLGKNSIFHTYYDVLSNSKVLENNSIDKENSFIFNIITCESGTEVFEKYNSKTEYQPTTKQIYIFIEKKDNKKSNLFGTACRVKMGEERKNLMQDLLNGKTNISVENETQQAYNLKQWAQDIAKYSKGQETEIEANVLLDAVKLELLNKSDFNQIIQTIFGLNNKLADWMNSGVEAMEEWKFTEENYEYVKFYVEPTYNKFYGFNNNKATYKPIIPIAIPHAIYADMANSKNIAATGISSLLTLAEKFDEIVMGIVYNVVKATPTITNNFFYAVIFYIKNYLEDYVLGSFKEIFKKIKELISLAINFLKDVTAKTADFLSEQLAILNAFLCGLINGIISLFQTIIVVLAFVVDNISILELEKATKTEISKNQEKLEFVEDLIDLISENATALFSGLVSMFTTTKIWDETIKFIDEVWKKSVNSIKNTSKYFWAYFIGAVAFELILDAVIAFFTGGTSLAVKATAKITRLATKAEELASKGIKLGNQFGKKVVENTVDLYKYLKKEFEELIEAIKSGNFIKWLKKKFYQLIGESPSQNDLLVHWDEISVSGRGRRLGQRLRKVDIEYLIKELKKLKVELQLHPLEGSFPIEGFFIRKGIPAMMPENAAAVFITDGTKMKIVLREEATVYEFFHEFMHYNHSQVLGLKKYSSLGGYGTTGEIVKEKWVYDKIIEHKDLMTKTELKHALDYLNDKPFGRNGLDPIDFDFDINKIPEVRKEIKIKEVLNKK